MPTQEMDLQRFAHLIKDIKFTMLTTVNEDGSLYSRPMATHQLDEKNFDGTLWFFTRQDTLKVHSIRHDQHVNLSYADSLKQQYISVSGLARMIDDNKRMSELWSPVYKAWFPEGLNDPQIALIEVKIENAEIWEAPPSKLVQLAGYVKAMVTGRPYDGKKHSQHLDIGHHH